MPFEVEEPSIELHKENIFHHGDLLEIVEEDGNFGRQLKWVINLDDDEDFIDDDGNARPRTTWTWCSPKLTTHENNKFRKYVKGLTGKEPQKGELFDERHWTKAFYEDHPDEDPEKLTGKKEPWRVAVMFQHTKKQDGSPTEKVTMLVSEDTLS